MRQVWHIFKKDVRRFWPQALATLILLAWFAQQDRWRADMLPSAMEGWLNLLLPIAWAYLIGSVVIEDPLVGDRQFWVTVPCRWRSLLAAKALFALAFIHIPYLVADGTILAARGFDPLQYLPHLLWKQLLLLLMLTLPAAAVAALTRNVEQYALATLALAAGIVMVNGYVKPLTSVYLNASGVPGNGLLALLAIALGALAIAFLQYASRRPALAQAIGVVVALTAVVAYAELPLDSAAAIECALSPAATASRPSVAVSPGKRLPDELRRRIDRSENAVTLAAPIEFSGMPADAIARSRLIELEIDVPGGVRYAYAYQRPQGILIDAYLTPWETPGWIQLMMEHAVYDRLKNGPVTMKGAIKTDFYRRGAPVWMAVGGEAAVPGLGKCSSMIQPRIYGFGRMFKVDCESPDIDPTYTLATLVRPETGEIWMNRLGSYGRSIAAPPLTWLSPLHHRDAPFQLTTSEVSSLPGAKWLVPEAALVAAKLSVTPELPAGSTLIRFEFSNLQLKDYIVTSPSK